MDWKTEIIVKGGDNFMKKWYFGRGRIFLGRKRNILKFRHLGETRRFDCFQSSSKNLSLS